MEGTRGLPDFLSRFRRRYAFLIGLAFALLAVSVLSRFILTVEVVGSEKVPTAQILSELRRYGVRPGAYGPGLDRKTIAQQALRELEGDGLVHRREYLEVPVRVEYAITEPCRQLIPILDALGDWSMAL